MKAFRTIRRKFDSVKVPEQSAVYPPKLLERKKEQKADKSLLFELLAGGVILASMVFAVIVGSGLVRHSYVEPGVTGGETTEIGTGDKGTVNGPTQTDPYATTGPKPEYYTPLEDYGNVPDALRLIIEENRFADVTAFADRLMRSRTVFLDSRSLMAVYRVTMTDLYDNVIAEYEVETDDAYEVTAMAATDDGGFLFVLGFMDYQRAENIWARDDGYASRVIKCDSSGKLQFDVALKDIEGDALKFCLELADGYYLFGTHRAPEQTKNNGETDVYAVKIRKNGKVAESRIIGGSASDSLISAEKAGNGFVLSAWSLSDDGDFKGSVFDSHGISDWTIRLNSDLEITGKEPVGRIKTQDYRLGEKKDGTPVFTSDPLFDRFDAGNPDKYIDYGDFYLIVSTFPGTQYPLLTVSSAAFYNGAGYVKGFYRATVYSAYEPDGKLLFRLSVDYNIVQDPEMAEWTKTDMSGYKPDYDSSSKLNVDEYLKAFKKSFSGGVYGDIKQREWFFNATPEKIAAGDSGIEIFVTRDGSDLFVKYGDVVDSLSSYTKYILFGGHYEYICLWDYDGNGVKDLVALVTYKSGDKCCEIIYKDLTNSYTWGTVFSGSNIPTPWLLTTDGENVYINGEKLIYSDGKFETLSPRYKHTYDYWVEYVEYVADPTDAVTDEDD